MWDDEPVERARCAVDAVDAVDAVGALVGSLSEASISIAGGRTGMRVADSGADDTLGVLQRRPATFGGLVRCQPPDGILRVGDLMSAWAPGVLALADAELGSGLGPLEAPTPVRTRFVHVSGLRRRCPFPSQGSHTTARRS